MKYSLGRIPSKFDHRDYKLTDFMPKGLRKLSTITSRKWDFLSDPLNQEATNHCVGFSMANFGINLPVQKNYTNQEGHAFYYMCKEIDGEPENEDGSYIRSAATVLRNRGNIQGYAFAQDIGEIKWWLLNRGPMIVGTIWTENMFEPDAISYTITPSGEVVGGHAYLLNEWTADNYIGIQNSWGIYWGNNGKGYISKDDFAKIFLRGGEAIAAVELEAGAKSPCWFAELFK